MLDTGNVLEVMHGVCTFVMLHCACFSLQWQQHCADLVLPARAIMLVGPYIP